MIKFQNLSTIKDPVLLLANDHLSTATFLCPPGVHCGEVWLYGIKKPFSMATFRRTCYMYFQVPDWNIHQILAVDSEKYRHVLYSIFNFGYIGSKFQSCFNTRQQTKRCTIRQLLHALRTNMKTKLYSSLSFYWLIWFHRGWLPDQHNRI